MGPFTRKLGIQSELHRNNVLYAVDKGLRGRNILQLMLLILLRICSRSVRPIPVCMLGSRVMMS